LKSFRLCTVPVLFGRRGNNRRRNRAQGRCGPALELRERGGGLPGAGRRVARAQRRAEPGPPRHLDAGGAEGAPLLARRTCLEAARRAACLPAAVQCCPTTCARGGRLEPVCKACACGLETPAPQGVLRAFCAETPPGRCQRACGAAGGVEEQRAGADAARAGWQQPARRAAAPRSPSLYPAAVLAGKPSAASNVSPVRTAHLTVLRR